MVVKVPGLILEMLVPDDADVHGEPLVSTVAVRWSTSDVEFLRLFLGHMGSPIRDDLA